MVIGSGILGQQRDIGQMWDSSVGGKEFIVYYKPNKCHQGIDEEAHVHCGEAKFWQGGWSGNGS